MCFETTASDTVCKGGVCIKLETLALQQLSTEYNRDDYKELLELTVHQKNKVQVPRGISPRALDGTCDLCDQDVAFQRLISHSTTPEHRGVISTFLLSKVLNHLL